MEPFVEALVRNYFEKKGLPWRPALTFEDVSIITQWSSIRSRSQIKNFQSRLAKNFVLNIPLISANMADVTDFRMAKALSRLGGLGFIPQFLPLKERVKEVLKVKRADNTVVNEPAIIAKTATLGEAKAKMAEYDISSILSVDGEGRLLGILTSRDYRLQNNDSVLVENLMRPMPLITAPPTVTSEEALRILENNKIEKLPLIDGQGKLAGLISSKDLEKVRKYPLAVRDKKGRLAVGASVRVTGDYLQEARELLAIGADALLLDTARGGSDILGEATQKIREAFPEAVLVAGNVDNLEHVKELVILGADCVKVGIGPGSRCKTRRVAGVGTPQIYAVASCAAVARKMGAFIIADGGIRESGDLAKVLVAGADAAMIGNLFAGTEESPGTLFWKGNQRWKQYRGSASLEHQLERVESGSLEEPRNPEGESSPTPYAGSLSEAVKLLIGGLRSSMSYIGAYDLDEFREKGEFLWVTNAGNEEGKPQI